MSNTAVGPVYAKIINDVLEASQVDFEEGGVDQNTLEKLRKIWQEKLSSIRVAQFPWEPTPAAPQPTPSTQQAQVKTQASSANATPAATPPAQSTMQPPIKTESARPTPQPAAYNPPPMPPNPAANMTAQQRAAAALQQKFGQQAAPQISQLQGQASYQRQPLPPSSGPYQNGQDVKPALSTLQQMQQAQRSTLPNSQTDGASEPEVSLADWKQEVARRRAEAAANPGEGDRLLKEHFLAMQQRMEGGGLLVPLEDRYYPKTSVKRKVNAMIEEPSTSTAAETATARPLHQFDGVDDDDDVKDDDDEDAINSDLDDPDELAGDPEADAETDQAMLCTYDKVQRVKNKWKCTLKDGILKVDGKEYVFHKGQGEFEW